MKSRIDAPRCFAIANVAYSRYTSRVAHTKAEDLRDLSALLASLRNLPGVVERKPGIFYRKGAGFLHFHDKDGERWADVKANGAWLRVDVAFGAGTPAQNSVLRAAQKALGE